MNYILEINAFNEWKFRNAPSTGQIALWFTLIDLNSKCGWKEWFGVANNTLMIGTGLSRASVVNCRDYLKEKGLIDFTTYGPNKSADYKMVSFASHNLYIPVDIPLGIQVANQVVNAAYNEMAASHNLDIPVGIPLAQSSTTTSLSTYSTTTATSESPMTIMDAHTKVFKTFNMSGLMSDYVMKLKSIGCDDNFIIELLFETGESTGNPNIRLMQTIGERWLKDGIQSRAQAKAQKDLTKAGEENAKYGRRAEGIRPGSDSAASSSSSITGGQLGWIGKNNVIPLQGVQG